mmetsp:Transcript_38721/g.81423  ORF Transcript_38721/g.81423 Transcript_38721/m.81423 type:complete len:213 (-) Transcript_38721:51-689(-)
MLQVQFALTSFSPGSLVKGKKKIVYLINADIPFHWKQLRLEMPFYIFNWDPLRLQTPNPPLLPQQPLPSLPLHLLQYTIPFLLFHIRQSQRLQPPLALLQPQFSRLQQCQPFLSFLETQLSSLLQCQPLLAVPPAQLSIILLSQPLLTLPQAQFPRVRSHLLEGKSSRFTHDHSADVLEAQVGISTSPDQHEGGEGQDRQCSEDLRLTRPFS